jgi:hypothetical protein
MGEMKEQNTPCFNFSHDNKKRFNGSLRINARGGTYKSFPTDKKKKNTIRKNHTEIGASSWKMKSNKRKKRSSQKTRLDSGR